MGCAAYPWGVYDLSRLSDRETDQGGGSNYQLAYWDDMPQGVAIADDPESRQALEEIARGCSPSLFPERFPPRPLLIQIGRQDQHYNVDRVIEFAEQLRNDFYQEEPEKVKLIVHEGTGHEFTPEMWDNALAWFKKYL